MGKCECCQTVYTWNESIAEVVDNRIVNKYIFICDKCFSLIVDGNNTSEDIKVFANLLVNCYKNKLLIEKECKRFQDDILYSGLKNIDKFDFNYTKKSILEFDEIIEELILEINNLYNKIIIELSLIGLKSTASDNYKLSTKELIEFLGIKSHRITKYKKDNGITGKGYLFNRKEINAILKCKWR